MAAKHGTGRCYREGCRCDDCRLAMREYNADLRRRKAAGIPTGPSGKVVSLPSTAANTRAAGPGPVEAAVLEEISDLQLTSDRPGLAAMAVSLAQLMDDGASKGKRPEAAAKLEQILEKLHKGADAKKSKLATVRAMTSVKTG